MDAALGSIGPAVVRPAALQPGDTVFGVTLVAPVGIGNVASVWTGLDGERLVAIKIFDPALLDDHASRAAFIRGGRAMERLAAAGDALSPFILRLHRRSTDGLMLITDLTESSAVDLPSLGWAPAEMLPFFINICRAVAFAHRAGVIHRGLKPSNILVGEDLEPRVGDFDLIDLPSFVQKHLSAGGYAVYAAPEELLGEGTSSPTADIYSLGRVLYFLLLGEEPDEPVADCPALHALASKPQGMVRIIRKCTMRKPAARYQSVDELIADLERHERVEEVGVAAPAFAPPSSRRLGPSMQPSSRLGASAPPSSRLGASAPPSSRLGASAPPPSSRFGASAPPSSRMGASAPPSSRLGASAPPPSSRMGASAPPSSRMGASVAPASMRAGASVAPRSQRSLQPAPAAPAPEPAWWPKRRTEQLLAAVGALVMVALIAGVALTPTPSASLLVMSRYGVLLGAALLTLALPRFERLVLARLSFAAFAMLLVQFVPGWLTASRLRATLSSKDPLARAKAVRMLTREGHRSFDGKDLSGLDLHAAELSVASFNGAKLERTDLSGAALMESTFDGADVSEAIVRGADLWSTNAQVARGWASVVCDQKTRMPEGWRCSGGHPTRRPEQAGGS